MEELKYLYEYKLKDEWQREWEQICKNRKNNKKKFSDEQKNHFLKLLDEVEEWIKDESQGRKAEIVRETEKAKQNPKENISEKEIEEKVDLMFKNKLKRTPEELKFLKYSVAFYYIRNNLFFAIEERSFDNNSFELILEEHKVRQLLLIFFHHYYLEYLDDESKEVVNEYLDPSEYNHRYELRMLTQFLSNDMAIIKNPEISIYKIDKAIIEQMDQYIGGEKEAFLEYQLGKSENPLKRLKSWKACIKDLFPQFKNSSSYELGLEFIEEQLSNSDLIKLSPPLKVNLSVPQLALFYRLLHEVGFYDNLDLKDVFGMLNKAYATKAKAYPALQSLSKSNDKLKKKDVGIIKDLIDKLSKKVDANLKMTKE